MRQLRMPGSTGGWGGDFPPTGPISSIAKFRHRLHAIRLRGGVKRVVDDRPVRLDVHDGGERWTGTVEFTSLSTCDPKRIGRRSRDGLLHSGAHLRDGDEDAGAPVRIHPVADNGCMSATATFFVPRTAMALRFFEPITAPMPPRPATSFRSLTTSAYLTRFSPPPRSGLTRRNRSPCSARSVSSTSPVSRPQIFEASRSLDGVVLDPQVDRLVRATVEDDAVPPRVDKSPLCRSRCVCPQRVYDSCCCASTPLNRLTTPSGAPVAEDSVDRSVRCDRCRLAPGEHVLLRTCECSFGVIEVRGDRFAKLSPVEHGEVRAVSARNGHVRGVAERCDARSRFQR